MKKAFRLCTKCLREIENDINITNVCTGYNMFTYFCPDCVQEHREKFGSYEKKKDLNTSSIKE